MPRRMPIQHHSSQFSSFGTSSPLEQPPCECIDGVALDWSGRGTSHVDYHKSEILPLVQGEFLGHGMQGGVYETSCSGVKLAWKRKYCRRKIDKRERREIKIIKKLSHHHIIRLMGAYTHGPFLGLLLWPVATCDLATLLEDVDWLVMRTSFWSKLKIEPLEDETEHEHDRKARLHALGIPIQGQAISTSPAATFLKQTIGCIASAVTFLHASDIKHKDLKPSNILLSRHGLWLTDFGTAADFSVLTTSVSENGERGTPKYFAPEVASFAPSGRSADIFSFGCIMFEIITLYMRHELQVSQRLRKSKDRSFQSNLSHIVGWFEEDVWIGSTAADDNLLGLVRWMIEEEEAARPTAQVVEEEVALINGLGLALCAQHARPRDMGAYRTCCSPNISADRNTTVPPTLKFEATIDITHGTTYLMSRPRPICTVYLRHSGGDLVESVHMFLDRTHRRSHVIIDSAPYEVTSIYGHDIGAYVVLRPGLEWSSPMTQPLPKTKERRMMPVFWLASFADAQYHESLSVHRVS